MSGAVVFSRLSPQRLLLGIAWALACLGALGWFTFRQMEANRALLERAGWSAYLKAHSTGAFYWRCLNQPTCAQALQRGTLGNAEITLTFMALVVGLSPILKRRKLQPRKTLTQRWANEHDIAPLVERRRPEQIVDAALKGMTPSTLTGYLGVWTDPDNPKKRYFLRPTKRLNDVHSITYAGTGGGKTVGSFRPRIALDAAEGNIAVVLDTKYPNPNDSYLDMRDYFRAFGRQVVIINPFERGDGIQIPVLAEVKGYDQALDIARLIYPPDLEAGEDPGAKVYTANARLLLAGIIHGLALGPRELRNFREVYNVANLGMESLRQWFAGRRAAADEIRSTLETDKKVFSGAINRLVEDLTIFRLDSAVETFSPGEREVDLDQVLLTPGMIHLVLPESYIRGSSGRAILRFFKRYLDGRMLSLAERLGKPLPIHINYYYDEFALFGFLPNLNDDLATLRSRNISLHMALQNRSQAMNIYGEIGWAATVDNNIGTTLILPGSFTQNDAKYWSEVLGEVSIEQYRVGESQVPDEFRKKVVRSVSAEEKTTALINIDELQRMELGELIAVVRGFPPIRLRSYPIERPESEGNPVAWVHRAMLAWRNAHLQRGIGERWIREARRFLEGAAAEPLPQTPAAAGEERPLGAQPQALPTEDSPPPPGVPASAGPEGDRLPGVRASARPEGDRPHDLSPAEAQQVFEDWMRRVAQEKIPVQAEGRPGRVNRFILSQALTLVPLPAEQLAALQRYGFVRYRRGLHYLVPAKCPWGRHNLALWEAEAYVSYRSTAEAPAGGWAQEEGEGA
ncbi:type IV secretory system conjugative DNA transfer family protein [Calidithermus roseus]|uniref:Type IV conjugative transfer system coupling protein TraD n=1 Tax=Calidithermus roseus TaxID=1644118 RepID=A0A399EI38_9DEIN|nr:type IV secretory system conjugative DNA transfer family protein [Calidithermus roseus]RIH84337.1 type IV conjugative transfer system coupling protein TraD [Calidithermus roseus]